MIESDRCSAVVPLCILIRPRRVKAIIPIYSKVFLHKSGG
jgi:hypothetical protein